MRRCRYTLFKLFDELVISPLASRTNECWLWEDKRWRRLLIEGITLRVSMDGAPFPRELPVPVLRCSEDEWLTSQWLMNTSLIYYVFIYPSMIIFLTWFHVHRVPLAWRLQRLQRFDAMRRRRRRLGGQRSPHRRMPFVTFYRSHELWTFARGSIGAFAVLFTARLGTYGTLTGAPSGQYLVQYLDYYCCHHYFYYYICCWLFLLLPSIPRHT